MTYQEWQKAGGVGFAQWETARYCGKHNINHAMFGLLPLADLVSSDSYFQRTLVGAMLLQPLHVSCKVTEHVKALIVAEYERHMAHEHKRERYGISCVCGAYYNPTLSASEIYGKGVARTWGVR